MSKICVFCSSADVDGSYKETAHELGKILAQNNHILVYGGINQGLMGIVASSARNQGGKIIGIIPNILLNRPQLYDEAINVKDLQDRKSTMTNISDAFIALPGGIGTLDEITTVLADQAIGHHNKPMAIINTNRYYEYLAALLSRGLKERFVKAKSVNLLYLAPDAQRAITFLESNSLCQG